MMKRIFVAGLWVIGAGAALAGTITGTVQGVPPTHEGDAGGGGAYDSRRYKFAEKIDYERLRDFVVYIDQPLSEITPGAPVLAAVTTQKDANFEPHVLPVAVGSSVRWPNEDDIYHNVFSTSDAKQFDLGFYKKERSPEVKFDQVGRVDVFCAIHTKMHCIILVVPNPFFASVDSNRRYVIKNVPAGTYHLRAWHERLPSMVRDVVVPAEGEVTVDFKLGIGDLPKY
ncbi:MAG: hypothetical protein JWM32_2875 [Verrucomicrobia bacterium]|nr:hypothetical protein [Verrucomicrobiota bacterium]